MIYLVNQLDKFGTRILYSPDLLAVAGFPSIVRTGFLPVWLMVIFNL
jgi:hypothetical protein